MGSREHRKIADHSEREADKPSVLSLPAMARFSKGSSGFPRFDYRPDVAKLFLNWAMAASNAFTLSSVKSFVSVIDW